MSGEQAATGQGTLLPDTGALPTDDGPRPSDTSGAKRARVPVIVGAISLVALIVVALVVLGREAGPVARFPIDTPEGTLQAYLEARDAGDAEAAWGYLSAQARRDTPFPAFEEQLRYAGEERSLVTLDEVRLSDGRATVRVTVTSIGEPGLFDRGRWSTVVIVRLVREDGQWRVDDPWFEWW
jgi:hypothetical protein